MKSQGVLGTVPPKYAAHPWAPRLALTLALFVTCTAALAIGVGLAFGQIFTQPDVTWYLKIAHGDSASVLQPFVLRQLGPLVCRALAATFHISIESAFLVEGVVSLLALLCTIAFILSRAGTPIFILAAVGGLAFWAELFNGLGLPDLWFSAVLGIFLLLLNRKHFFTAALMLFPLFLSRESSILVVVCLFIAGWRRMRRIDYIVALIASYAGMRLTKLLTAGGRSNQEHLNPVLYLLGKLPWNFAKNVLGMPLWNDLNQGNCSAPHWLVHLHLGGVHALGFCDYQPSIQLWTLRLALSSFGILPLLFLRIWTKRPQPRWPQDVLLRFCIVYGVISFLIAPALGSSVPRLFGYAWPLFIVAVPLLAASYLSVSRKSALLLVTLHLAVSWLTVLNHFAAMELQWEFMAILALACAYALAWMLLRRATLVEMAH